MLSYFNSQYLNILLKKAMGCSTFCWVFCNQIPAMVCSDAYEKTKKSLEKYGLTKTGTLVIAFLISLKYFLASTVHLISLYLFSMFVTFISISLKLGMNIINEFTCQMNDCTSFLLLGASTFRLEFTLSGQS